MPLIENILTPAEMERMAEPNEFGIAFYAPDIFEDYDNYHMEGPVHLTGDEITTLKRQAYFQDKTGLRGSLPGCRQHHVGRLCFYALTGGRRIVVFEPSDGYKKVFPHGYMVRGYNPLRGPSFALHSFPHTKKAHEPDPFLRLVPEPPGEKIVGVLSQLECHEISALVGFTEAQWRTVYNMLCAWIPE